MHFLLFFMVLLSFFHLNAEHSISEQTSVRRVVSLTPYTDTFVQQFTPSQKVAALSPSISEPKACNPQKASDVLGHFPRHAGGLQNALHYKPDLVVLEGHKSLFTQAALAKIGIASFVVSHPKSITDCSSIITQYCQLVGNLEKATQYKATLQEFINQQPQRLHRTIVLLPGNLTCGKNTLFSELLSLSGCHNVVSELSHSFGWGNITMDRILRLQPSIMITLYDHRQERSQASQNFQHPALKSLAIKRIHLSSDMAENPLIYAGRIIQFLRGQIS